jgi:hypothetical protein
VEEHKDDWRSLLTMDPAEAAAIIVAGVERRRPRVLITRTAKVLDALVRLMPVGYTKVLAAGARRRTARPVPGARTAAEPEPSTVD